MSLPASFCLKNYQGWQINIDVLDHENEAIQLTLVDKWGIAAKNQIAIVISDVFKHFQPHIDDTAQQAEQFQQYLSRLAQQPSTFAFEVQTKDEVNYIIFGSYGLAGGVKKSDSYATTVTMVLVGGGLMASGGLLAIPGVFLLNGGMSGALYSLFVSEAELTIEKPNNGTECQKNYTLWKEQAKCGSLLFMYFKSKNTWNAHLIIDNSKKEIQKEIEPTSPFNSVLNDNNLNMNERKSAIINLLNEHSLFESYLYQEKELHKNIIVGGFTGVATMGLSQLNLAGRVIKESLQYSKYLISAGNGLLNSTFGRVVQSTLTGDKLSPTKLIASSVGGVLGNVTATGIGSAGENFVSEASSKLFAFTKKALVESVSTMSSNGVNAVTSAMVEGNDIDAKRIATSSILSGLTSGMIEGIKNANQFVQPNQSNENRTAAGSDQDDIPFNTEEATESPGKELSQKQDAFEQAKAKFEDLQRMREANTRAAEQLVSSFRGKHHVRYKVHGRKVDKETAIDAIRQGRSVEIKSRHRKMRIDAKHDLNEVFDRTQPNLNRLKLGIKKLSQHDVTKNQKVPNSESLAKHKEDYDRLKIEKELEQTYPELSNRLKMEQARENPKKGPNSGKTIPPVIPNMNGSEPQLNVHQFIYDDESDLSLSDVNWDEMLEGVVLVHALNADAFILNDDGTPKINLETENPTLFMIKSAFTPEGKIGNHLEFRNRQYDNDLIRRPHLHWFMNQLVQEHSISSWEESHVAILEPLSAFEQSECERTYGLAPYDVMTIGSHVLSDKGTIIVPKNQEQEARKHLKDYKGNVATYDSEQPGVKLREVIDTVLTENYKNAFVAVDEEGNKVGNKVAGRNNPTYNYTSGHFRKTIFKTKTGKLVLLLSETGENDSDLSSAMRDAKNQKKFIGFHHNSVTYYLQHRRTKYLADLAQFKDNPASIKGKDLFAGEVTELRSTQQLGIFEALKMHDDLCQFNANTGIQHLADYLLNEGLYADLASLFYKDFAGDQKRFNRFDIMLMIAVAKDDLHSMLTKMRDCLARGLPDEANKTYLEYRSRIKEIIQLCIESHNCVSTLLSNSRSTHGKLPDSFLSILNGDQMTGECQDDTALDSDIYKLWPLSGRNKNYFISILNSLGVDERQTNLPVSPCTYEFYTDSEIYHLINCQVQYIDQKRFLLCGESNGQFHDEDGHDYFVCFTSAIDADGTIPQDFYLNKDKQPRPDDNYVDDRKDVFDEFESLLKVPGECHLKIIFPYNINEYHWLTGEIQIHRDSGHAYTVLIFAHDSLGSTTMDNNVFSILRDAVQLRITQIDPTASISFMNKASPYKTRRQKSGNECGVIAIDEIIKRIHGKSLDRSKPYFVGAYELREKHIAIVKAVFDPADVTRINFLKKYAVGMSPTLVMLIQAYQEAKQRLATELNLSSAEKSRLSFIATSIELYVYTCKYAESSSQLYFVPIYSFVDKEVLPFVVHQQFWALPNRRTSEQVEPILNPINALVN